MPDRPIVSIVDDDISMRDAVKTLVKSFGLEANTFACAEAFLQSGQVEETSCLITDWQMPGMSGVELQELLTARGHSTPIIFMTAFPEQRIRTRVLRAGAVAFLPKPFSEECLIDCLEMALRNAGLDGYIQ
jgi:FixJ family two-component response regulator